VVEFAWDRIDEATAGKPSSLGRRCQEWVRGSQGETWAPAESHFVEWASKEGFHSSRQMRDELGRRFVERHFEWVPYLYPELGEDVSEADESAAIEAGTINATGFRYVGAYRDL
jgi:hypothetical protein